MEQYDFTIMDLFDHRETAAQLGITQKELRNLAKRGIIKGKWIKRGKTFVRFIECGGFLCFGNDGYWYDAKDINALKTRGAAH